MPWPQPIARMNIHARFIAHVCESRVQPYWMLSTKEIFVMLQFTQSVLNLLQVSLRVFACHWGYCIINNCQTLQCTVYFYSLNKCSAPKCCTARTYPAIPHTKCLIRYTSCECWVPTSSGVFVMIGSFSSTFANVSDATKSIVVAETPDNDTRLGSSWSIGAFTASVTPET